MNNTYNVTYTTQKANLPTYITSRNSEIYLTDKKRIRLNTVLILALKSIEDCRYISC